VPITLLNNHKVMHDGEFAVHRQTIRAIVHKPIDTTGLTQDDVENLKSVFYGVVQGALDNDNAKELTV
jgi:1-acyl-sn-glycerol-3-phosphate acyltransferase